MTIIGDFVSRVQAVSKTGAASEHSYRSALEALFNALAEGVTVMIKALQDHVKMVIAPYKYPRRVLFVAALPKTLTGKIQRFRLREGG